MADRMINLRKMSWRNREQVIELCRQLGPGNAVVKYRSRPNYNIVKADRLSLLPPTTSVVFISKREGELK